MIKNNENNSSTPLTSASLSTSSAGLLPKFRFPEFVKDMEWNKKMLGKLVNFQEVGLQLGIMNLFGKVIFLGFQVRILTKNLSSL
jgi:hypothetical protein